MKKLLLSLVPVLVLAACSAEASLKQELADANFCETENDCVMIGSKCPFDCYIYVNSSRADEMKSKVDAFQSTCEYSCIQSQGVKCEDQKCVTIVDAPPAPDPEGNVGAACTSHEECITPMSYLTRSSCPFASQCIEGTCAVVCPMMEQDVNPDVSAINGVSCSADSDCSCSQFAAGTIESCSCVDNLCVAVMKE